MLWIARRTIDSTSKWMTALMLLGYGVLVGAMASGAVRTWSDITDIL